MKTRINRKYIYVILYIAAIFAVIYGCKYIMDALVYAVTNLNSLLFDLTSAAGRILSVFIIVVMGFVFAYVLEPAVAFFQKHLKIKRIYSVTLLYFLIILLTALIIYAVIHKIGFYDRNNITNAFYLAYMHYKKQFIDLYNDFYALIRKYDFGGIFYTISDIVNNVDIDFLGIVRLIGKWSVNIFLSLIVAFYFLKDKTRILFGMNKYLDIIFPDKAVYAIKNVFGSIHEVFSGYIRGQLTDALLMSVLIACSLSILKIPFAVPIGILSGFTNIIPFFGAIMGFFLSVVTALISSGVLKAVIAGVVMLVLQQIDSIIIVPRIVGDNVSLSPVMVIIALAIAGNIFGIWGMVFAVPVTALIKTFIKKWLSKLENKKFDSQKI